MTKTGLQDYLIQELRCTAAAVVCRELVFERKADGADSERQMLLQEKACHGSEGHESVLHQLMCGKGKFQEMFLRLDIDNCREGNELRRDGAMLELKSFCNAPCLKS